MKNNKLTVLVFVVFLLTASAAIMYMYVRLQDANLDKQNNSSIDGSYIDTITEQGGSSTVEHTAFNELYLTLTPSSTGTTDGYFYDFNTGRLNLIKPAGGGLRALHSFSDSGLSSTYLASGLTGGNIDTRFKLMYKDSDGLRTVVSELAEPLRGQAPISPDGERILFTKRIGSFNTNNIPDASDFDIYMATLQDDGTWETKKMWDGMSPRWLTDGLFYYLKNDGIYIGVVNEGVEDYVYKTSDVLGGNSNISVSDDGNLLAWALPDSGKVIVFSNEYDESIKTFKLTELYTIQESAFWLAFSPDDETLAMQVVDWDSLNTDPNPRIEFYHTSTGSKFDDALGLADFVQSAMFLTDWR